MCVCVCVDLCLVDSVHVRKFLVKTFAFYIPLLAPLFNAMPSSVSFEIDF